MTEAQTFEWMRKRIYEELEPEVTRLRQENVRLALELAALRTQKIRDEEAKSYGKW